MRLQCGSFVTGALARPHGLHGRPTGAPRTFPYVSQKIRKTSFSLLTGRGHVAIHHLTNEGGAPLATKKFASKSALDEIIESRL